jgi:hypothetical protein
MFNPSSATGASMAFTLLYMPALIIAQLIFPWIWKISNKNFDITYYFIGFLLIFAILIFIPMLPWFNMSKSI